MNLPNKLTMLRIILIPVFLVLVLVESWRAGMGGRGYSGKRIYGDKPAAHRSRQGRGDCRR